MLLEALGDDDWEKLLSYTTRVPFRAGDVVIQRGERDRTLYIVVEGSLAVMLPKSDNLPSHEPIVLQAGAVLGEVAFFDARPRSADVRAITDGELLCFGYADFERFAAAEPVLARHLVVDLGRILAARLRNIESPDQ